MSKVKHNPSEDLLILDDDPGQPGETQALSNAVRRVQTLWQHRRLLGRIAAYGLLASLLLAFAIPRKYESTARLMPPDSKSSSAGLATLAALTSSSREGGGIAPLIGDMFGLKTSSSLFIGVLKSRTVQDRLIEQFDLRRRYRLLPFGTSRIEDIRDELTDNTSVSEDRKSGIVTLAVTDKDPQRAREMARAYVRELNRLVAEVSTSDARSERIFLEERLKSIKTELDQAAGEFSRFASRNVTIDIKEQSRAMVEAAAALQAQLIVTETELQGLRQIYTDENVRVRSAKARIHELKQQIDKLGGGDLASAPDLDGQSTQYPSIRKLPLLGVEYANHYRRQKIAEMAFEMLTRQYEIARVQEAKEIPTVSLLDDPVVPEKGFPSRMLIIAGGTVVALLCGCAWILAGVRWKEVDPAHPGKRLAAEVWQEFTSKGQKLFSRNGSGRNGGSPQPRPAVENGVSQTTSAENSNGNAL